MLENDSPPSSPPARRPNRVSWWFSLILVAAAVAGLGTILYVKVLHHPAVSGTVLDAYTLTPVAGAVISANQKSATTDSNGKFTLKGNVDTITATKPGYAAAQATVGSNGDSLRLMLRPDVLRGTVVSSATHQPIAEAKVSLVTGSATVDLTTTDASGSFTLENVPPEASISVDASDFAGAVQSIGKQTKVDIALTPNVLTGTVTDNTGKPIIGAVVAVSDHITHTNSDGKFRLEGVTGSGTVYFKASGYEAVSKALNPTLRLDASLTPIQVRAIYATANTAANQQSLDALIKIADTTDVNALVVDLKDATGHVYYDSKVPLATQIGAVSPILDPVALVNELHQHHIYAIARLVVFEDPILANARPDLAIHDSKTGGLWHTYNGLAWVNAHEKPVWDYDTALAREVASFGFDEIQLDYIRFPTDGPMADAEYGVAHTDQTRPAAIGDFLTEMYAAIAPTHAYLAADVFGLTLWETGDGQIGQNLETVAQHLDYICPMLYPSHFYAGSMGFDIPNDHPYEVVLWSLQNAEKRLPQDQAKFRPWLQDFSLGQGIAYGPTEVKRQIDASHDAGTSGWMLWNAGNEYHTSELAANGST